MPGVPAEHHATWSLIMNNKCTSLILFCFLLSVGLVSAEKMEHSDNSSKQSDCNVQHKGLYIHRDTMTYTLTHLLYNHN
jgi:hypothetical protein